MVEAKGRNFPAFALAYKIRVDPNFCHKFYPIYAISSLEYTFGYLTVHYGICCIFKIQNGQFTGLTEVSE